jgi:hypothetical protein
MFMHTVGIFAISFCRMKTKRKKEEVEEEVADPGPLEEEAAGLGQSEEESEVDIAESGPLLFLLSLFLAIIILPLWIYL